MQIKILDQVHLSGVRATTLAAGEIVNVSRDLGAELLAKHPDKFEAIAEADAADQAGAGDQAAVSGDAGEGAKSEPPARNKAEPTPANKAARPPRGKRGRGKS